MRWHTDVLGSSLRLSPDALSAARRPNAPPFHSLLVSRDPVGVGAWVCLSVTASGQWLHCLRLGLTSLPPDQLCPEPDPPFLLPAWDQRTGVWLRPVTELAFVGSSPARVSVNVNGAGQLHLYINGVHKGALLNGLPVRDRLWLLVDACGDVGSVRILPSNDAPAEITGRGGGSLSAYQRACETGTRPVHRTRLMLVGEDGAGKTSLIKVLTGQKWSHKEESTPAIDLSASCSFSAPSSNPWRLTSRPRETTALREDDSDEELFEQHLSKLTASDADEERLECAAQNRALEILFQQQGKAGQKSPRNRRSTPVEDAVTASEEATGRRVNQLVAAVREKRQSVTRDEDEVDVTLNIWDFGGQVIYYTTHQLFLTHRAVYLIVFNMEHDLDAVAAHPVVGNYQDTSVFSHMDYLDYWFNLIHSHAAETPKEGDSDFVDIDGHLSPPIFVVGTHANSLGSSTDDIRRRAEICFDKIRDYVRYKVYARHVVPEYYLVESSAGEEDTQLAALREHIERTVRAQSYMGEMIPVKWLRLESRIEAMRQQGTHLVWISQMLSLGQEEGLYNEEDILPALDFLHDLGVIIFFGKAESPLNHVVIIDPQWLVELFRAVLSAKPVDLNASVQTGEAWYKLRHSAVLDERLLDTYWASHRHAKLALIGLMEKFDLAAERLPNPVNASAAVERSFYVPSLLKPWSSADPNFYDSPNSVIFYLKFQHFLPDGLFQRLLSRSILWSQEQGGRDPVLYYNKAWFFVDQEHDFALEMHPYRLSRIKVSVYRVGAPPKDDKKSVESVSRESERSEEPGLPSAHVVAKVRHFLEAVLEELRRLWMRRMAYQVVVACPCGSECRQHSTPGCGQTECLHFLNIDECLSHKVVCCGHRRVRTDHWQSWFPSSIHKDGYAPPILPNHVLSSDVWNIEVQKGQFLPHWMKAAAKLLNGAVEGQDWKALSEQLGYNEAQINRFNEDLNPALLLIADWVITNGNTNLAVDMLVACLHTMGRADIAEAIEADREADLERVQVFLSYQWDAQESARALRDHLERAGFACWMDIGQMGGGDLLLARVERALRHCRLVVAVVTPRFVLSPACTRELCLADLLRKPLVPVLLERTPWPPPGPMALLLAQYVYVDLCGVGGHGGSGAAADRAARLQEVLAQVGKHAEPELVVQQVEVRREEVEEVAHGDSDSEETAEAVVVGEPESPRGAEEGREEEGVEGAARPVSPLRPVSVRRCAVCLLL